MPKRSDIKTIAIIGAGPIIIGQACEFDYSGTQACKALKEEGYRVVLVNSNPATIMTDPGFADATYIEPVTPALVEKILERERPDALLPTMGGQTGLNTAMKLAENGTLDRLGIELIGARAEVIVRAEDRLQFREVMEEIGLECPASMLVHSAGEAQAALDVVGLPAILRPSFTLAGTGGGIAYNRDEYFALLETGIRASPVSEVLVEESVLGWKEYEMEVVRDHADNCIIVCSIENIDPMGIHTGDSVTVAPALTLTDKEYQRMRDASIACLRRIGVDTGGSNVQFAIDPESGRMVVIEMNPRVSRSSALASKATGFPIAKIAAKLAVGYTLDELDNDITGATPASFEPTIDYVVTKIPRFTFEKFPGADATLTTAMKSVGEAMAIGRTFQESFQKALCSMETDLTGLDEIAPIPEAEEGADSDSGSGSESESPLLTALRRPVPERLLLAAEAYRGGHSTAEIHEACRIDPWFLEQISDLVCIEDAVRRDGLPGDAAGILRLKQAGFSDARLGTLSDLGEAEVARFRRDLGVRPVFKRVDTCAAEFPARTPYMYSVYERAAHEDGVEEPESEIEASDRRKVVILGGGPNRIGQGIEFDYCCVHAAFALSEAGLETIMVNCNPETVSTDYDTSDRLYFEPLTAEHVTELITAESVRGTIEGVIVQFGGQTPLKLSRVLEAAGIPILGTSPDAIDRAEDRDRFQNLIDELGLQQPANGTAHSVEDAVQTAREIGYPVLLRPSYVLGGRAMELVHDDAQLRRYMATAALASGDHPVLIDHYLRDAVELDVDALADGEQVHVAGIMEHIEEAGIHSGDSACSLPPHSLGEEVLEEIREQTRQLASALGVVGLMNVQYAVRDGVVHVIEVNPRASRTAPFVAKATGVPLAKIAARIMVGDRLSDFNLEAVALGDHIAVKEAVFPFRRFPGIDVMLGPEMKSTGEVMGLDRDFGRAFAKAQLGTGGTLPDGGTVFVSVKNDDKEVFLDPVRTLVELGFEVMATRGTARYMEQHGITVRTVNKVLEGNPHIVDAMINGEVQLVFNTTEGAEAIRDSRDLRRTALMRDIPYYTTQAGAVAAVMAIEALRAGPLEVASLQSYFGHAF